MEDGGTGSDVKREAQGIAENAQDRIEGLRGYAEEAGQRIRELARERPVAAIAIAAGLGFLMGRLLSRT
jgi:ElaB/YqjD/DUF883 family membrane-anchored ribosome-binding protein